MLLSEIASLLNLKQVTEGDTGCKVCTGYASDLLSDVLGKASAGTLWVTNQKHQNIIGVSVLLNLSGVIIAGGIAPDDDSLEKARMESFPVFITNLSLYEVVGRLWEAGIKACC